MTTTRIGCPLCDKLAPGELVDLDLLMGDAGLWPDTVWGIFSPPKGPPSPLRLRFGARNVALSWLFAHGYVGMFKNREIDHHYRFDVPVVATSAADLFKRGLIESVHPRGHSPTTDLTVPEAIDPKAFLTFFNRGIILGNRALELLATRLEAITAEGGEVPFALLGKLVEQGSKLATTQATLTARGLRMGDEGDAEEGFRSGSQPLPSDRIAHHRIRTIEGQRVVVVDEGQKDREHFSERDVAEGGRGLPH
jgi:hypothetical protein